VRQGLERSEIGKGEQGYPKQETEGAQCRPGESSGGKNAHAHEVENCDENEVGRHEEIDRPQVVTGIPRLHPLTIDRELSANRCRIWVDLIGSA
jgi:hypothetical protein